MKKVTLLLPLAVLTAATTMAFGQLQAPGGENTPAVGETAPDYGLDEFQGQSKVLLAFFPAAFTGG